MEPQQIIIIALAAIAAAALAFIFAVPSQSRADKRHKAVRGSRVVDRVVANAARDATARRNQVSESLKELEKRGSNSRKIALSVRLERAGLDWNVRRFYGLSLISGMLFGLVGFVSTGLPVVGLLAAFAGGLGLPRWVLGYRTKRRQNRFIKEFPNAIDLIVRGVRSGLPLGDCIRMVAGEAQEPVRSEFRAVVEVQAVGVPLGEAVERLYQRTGVAEANFFGIVLAIQGQAGGNLSEALSNLARVLRERAKMKGKIQAMSMEAKSSAGIIGSLPILVGGGVYFMTPDYLEPLWTTSMGLVMLCAAGFWMMCGILIMRRMINFDF
ncbi:type II secretion system F family protein [Terrihabitans rhizophilus]|uniref:Type II secretion system F family protein n=1 Tax=Terrihabitans rhizophilus TaxID=3092662 RepID=A0ABU4RL96_9HYPH|nr:type II secretion system F family protein [Terrihabitans sp. PJ23]MDX6804505.1 type II secretion system F family protein [Terrihabitans sp. PJ23]